MDKSICSIISKKYAMKKCVLPLSIKNGKLHVKMLDYDIGLINELKLISGKEVAVKIGNRGDIIDGIDKLYGKEEGDLYSDNNLLETIINKAIANDASDIHIEPFEDYFRIRYRINGDLIEIERYGLEYLPELRSMLKLMSGCDIGENRLAQDGRFSYSLSKSTIDIRMSIIPTINGEKLVLRLLDHNKFLQSRSKLGFSSRAIEMIDQIIGKKSGMLIVSGPTGSGKTSTIYSIINELKNKDINITSIEDPVEYKVDGINQIQVNEKIGLDFEIGLRSILRQDPDCIIVGEIRDKTTAEIALRAAITGHIVISSLHTNDAVGSIYRLLDMGVEPFMVSAAVNGIVCQNLVKRKLIEKEYESDNRVLLYEIIKLDTKIKESISRKEDQNKIRKIAIENGMITYEDSIKEKAWCGKT